MPGSRDEPGASARGRDRTGTVAAGPCGADNSPSQVTSPGEPERPKTAALEAGAALLQDKPPVDALNACLDGFHFYSGDMNAQMEAHHYCGHVNEELIQCAIFDGNGGDAKLMGVEHIVSAKLHTDRQATLPLGVPQLMMGFTEEGQIDAQLVQARDERFKVRSADKRQQRADIPAPPVDPGANAWQRGRVIQLPDPTSNHTANPR